VVAQEKLMFFKGCCFIVFWMGTTVRRPWIIVLPVMAFGSISFWNFDCK